MVVNSSTWWAQSHLVGPQNDDRQVRAVEGKDRGVGRPVDHLEAPLPPRVVGVSGGEAQLDQGVLFFGHHRLEGKEDLQG